MGERVYESITEEVTATGFTVRVWRTEASFEATFSAHSEIVETIRANADNPEMIRAALEAMERAADISAIEIKNTRYKNGGIVYPDWG